MSLGLPESEREKETFGIFRKHRKAKKNTNSEKDHDGTSKDFPGKISAESGISSKVNQNDRLADNILDVKKDLEELRRIGLSPSSLKEFTLALHKLAVASSVSPSVLTAIIKEVNDLCQDKRISLLQAHKQISDLRMQRDALLKEMEDLVSKKKSVELDLGLSELENASSKQILSEYTHIKKELEEHKLSFDDVLKLVNIIKDSVEQLGPNSSSIIVETLGDLKSKQEKRKQMESEIENLFGTKQALQDKLLNLESEISAKSQTLNSVEELRKMGLDFSELDKLSSAIKTIASTRNIDTITAKNQLLSDLEGYYANDHELRKRIRILESLLQEKEDKFKMLEEDYQNEKVILEYSKKLISSGFDKQWMEKLQAVMDKYGKDIEVLTRELEQQQDLKANIADLQQKKRALEEEERLLRQKLISEQDQRVKTLALIHEMMATKRQTLSSELDAQKQTQISTENDLGLGELLRAARGDVSNIDESRFRSSARSAIDIISKRLHKNSPARVALEHAQLAMRLEDERNRQSEQNS